MHVSVLQEQFKRGIGIVSRVAGKSTLPVLSNILIATDEGRLKLAATNLEIGFTCWIGAKIEDEGAVTVPAKLVSDVVGGLPNERITLERDARAQTLHLTCARTEANIKGIDADEFPSIPTVADRALTVSLPPDLLREAIEQVAIAAATDDTRPVLAGVLLRVRDATVTLAAANGFRLAVRTMTLPEPVNDPIEVIVPARALQELSRTLGDVEGNVAIAITPSDGQICFTTASFEMASRLLEGKFPDYERIIPSQHTTRAVLETQELAKAVKLASYFATASSNIVKLTIEPGGERGPGRLTITANATEVGDNQSALDGIIHGEGGQIALNVKLLQDALGVMKAPQVAIETLAAQAPAVFKPVGSEDYLHIVMPMTVR